MSTIPELEAMILIHENAIINLKIQIEELKNPTPVLPLPLTVDAGHGDIVPVPGGLNVIAKKNVGKWSDPATWSTGRVPAGGDRVRIPDGISIILDCDAVCDVLVVDGGLGVDTDLATSLTVTTMFGLPTAEFQCGYYIDGEAHEAESKFELIFRDAPLSPVGDPKQYWNGLIWFGRWDMHGRTKLPYIYSADDWKAGERGFAFGHPVGAQLALYADGWEKGDEIIVHDTRETDSYDQCERHTVFELSGIIETKLPMKYNHFMGKNDNGFRDTPFRVVNVTRNLIVRNEKPDQKVSGHVMFLDHAEVDIRYVVFRQIGRTLNEKLTTPESELKNPGTSNRIGRYALHLHHLHKAFHVEGCVYDGGDLPNSKKWGIPVIHDCHFGTAKDNVTYNISGAGVVTEEGNEWANKIHNNTVILVHGKGGRADAGSKQGGLAMQGCGFWCSAPGSEWIDNYAANCKNYGHIATCFYLGYFEHPDKPGSHTLVEVDGNAIGFAAFSRNTSFACEYGGTNWWTGTQGNKPRPALKETIFEDFSAVNCSTYCWFQYPCADTTWLRFKTRGSKVALGFYGADYTAIRLRIVNPDMQGLRTGWSVSVNDGPQTLEGGWIYADACINLGVPWTSAANASGLYEQLVLVNGTVLKGKALLNRFFPTSLGSKTTNLMVKQSLVVRAFQGEPGDDFEVYLLEQAPNYVPPKTIPNLTYPPAIKLVGSPEEGLTNAALWAKYKVAVAGKVAPCLTKRPGILGYTCP